MRRARAQRRRRNHRIAIFPVLKLLGRTRNIVTVATYYRAIAGSDRALPPFSEFVLAICGE
jgi:hypothetical protein